MMHPLRWAADGFRRFRQRRRESAARRLEGRALRGRVEEVVSATEPKIRLVRGYQTRMGPSVKMARQYCRELVDQIPGPFEIRPDRWGRDPLVTAYFVTVEEVKTALAGCRELRRYFAERSAPAACALLTMAPEERQVFGTALSGAMLQRDVKQSTLHFARHRFTSPAGVASDLKEALCERAFAFLLSCALEKIAALREEELRLNRDQEILEVQWRLQNSRDRGLGPLLDPVAGPPRNETGKRILAELDRQLDAVRSKLDEPSDYLAHVLEVLDNPELFLRLTAAAPRLDPMGRRVKETDPEPGHPIPYAKIVLGPGGRTLAAVIAGVFRSDVVGEQGGRKSEGNH